MQYLCKIGEWTRRDMQLCQFKNYDLTYAFYSKFPSWGCQEELCAFTASIFISYHPPFPLLKPFYFNNNHNSTSAVFLSSSNVHKTSYDSYSSIISLWSTYRFSLELLSKLTYNNMNFNLDVCNNQCSRKTFSATKNFEDFRTSPLSIHVYISFMLFILIFSFNDFSSPLILFSWWRNKISWGLLKTFKVVHSTVMCFIVFFLKLKRY